MEFPDSMPQHERNLLFDPQTSGGLLIALPPDSAQSLVETLHQSGNTVAVVVGKITRQPDHKIIVK
jgi:selenide,water dikinase